MFRELKANINKTQLDDPPPDGSLWKSKTKNEISHDDKDTKSFDYGERREYYFNAQNRE